ncbi:uncharacterized protein LOC106530817 [Austrofundulus limnaeus]|uniref:Uncharacterized protein LOC106530817 n=1 Tax=Austrofundulus limnaeus TaxID=52670 RepID=A0A2I4CPS1_AUSLI|nr:PREDICTED: uncharacterized protein LOC106530817 [Austrofundulus limnaeus]
MRHYFFHTWNEGNVAVWVERLLLDLSDSWGWNLICQDHFPSKTWKIYLYIFGFLTTGFLLIDGGGFQIYGKVKATLTVVQAFEELSGALEGFCWAGSTQTLRWGNNSPTGCNSDEDHSAAADLNIFIIKTSQPRRSGPEHLSQSCVASWVLVQTHIFLGVNFCLKAALDASMCPNKEFIMRRRKQLSDWLTARRLSRSQTPVPPLVLWTVRCQVLTQT